MTVHECPHCECDECVFCGEHLGDGSHNVEWDYYKPPPAYSKKTGHQRSKQVDVCNTCAMRVNMLLAGLQSRGEGVHESAVNEAADHPALQEDA